MDAASDAGSSPSPCASALTREAGCSRCCAGRSYRSGGRPPPRRPKRSPRKPAPSLTAPRGEPADRRVPTRAAPSHPLSPVSVRRAHRAGYPAPAVGRIAVTGSVAFDTIGVRRALRRPHPPRQDQRAEHRVLVDRVEKRRAEPPRISASRWRCSAKHAALRGRGRGDFVNTPQRVVRGCRHLGGAQVRRRRTRPC